MNHFIFIFLKSLLFIIAQNLMIAKFWKKSKVFDIKLNILRSISNILGIALFSRSTTPYIIPYRIRKGKKIIVTICEQTVYRQKIYLKNFTGPTNKPTKNREKAAINVIVRTKIPIIINSKGMSKTKNKK